MKKEMTPLRMGCIWALVAFVAAVLVVAVIMLVGLPGAWIEYVGWIPIAAFVIGWLWQRGRR